MIISWLEEHPMAVAPACQTLQQRPRPPCSSPLRTRRPGRPPPPPRRPRRPRLARQQPHLVRVAVHQRRPQHRHPPDPGLVDHVDRRERGGFGQDDHRLVRLALAVPLASGPGRAAAPTGANAARGAAPAASRHTVTLRLIKDRLNLADQFIGQPVLRHLPQLPPARNTAPTPSRPRSPRPPPTPRPDCSPRTPSPPPSAAAHPPGSPPSSSLVMPGP